MEDIRKEIVIAASMQTVWEALCTSEGLASWLMPNDFRPLVGARFRFETGPDCNMPRYVESEVIAIDKPRRIAFTWSVGGRSEPTLVTIELRELVDGTRVTLTHTGWAEEELRSQHDSGWNEKLAALNLCLDG